MNNLNLKLQNSYTDLPEVFFTRISPTPVTSPEIVLFNDYLSESLNLSLTGVNKKDLAATLSGNLLPNNTNPISQAYAGHQFGHFSILGDGRAIVIGEHITKCGKRFDIQFKGSGPTPYSRQGDGRATLSSMLREYLISEAMNALGIPTTRSLAVVSSGESVYRNKPLPGAILTRVASSHIRVGTFQYAAASGQINNLKALTNYTIKRHYPLLLESDYPALALLEEVSRRQAKLIAEWMGVGFIHGVMNTDNMTISGEAIDYGPCAFLDKYDPSIAFSSIDHGKRYAFEKQAAIANWNLARFAESLLPLIDPDKDTALKLAENSVNQFRDFFESEWLRVMRKKMLIPDEKSDDPKLIWEFLEIMQSSGADYTNSFYALTNNRLDLISFSKNPNFINWHKKWQNRTNQNLLINEDSNEKSINPAYIPRNHKVEEALQAVEVNGNIEPFKRLLTVISNPYKIRDDFSEYLGPSEDGLVGYQTFCGT